jgi:two-component sensor histidine kinase
VVRSIVRRTAETSEDIEEMAQHLQGRIDAFARIQSMVARNPDSGVDLTDLVEEEMLVYALREGERLAIGGPPLTLQPRSAETLSLAIHELATNAVKYGALGSETGRVHISWALTGDGSSLDFAWVESGLPGNAAEIRSDGFGMELLLRTLPYELGAETAFELAPDGCRFTMRVAADRLQMEASSAGL